MVALSEHLMVSPTENNGLMRLNRKLCLLFPADE